MSDQTALLIPDGNRALLIVDETKLAEVATLVDLINFLDFALSFVMIDADKDSSNE